MAVVKAQKIPQKKVKVEDILMQFCYHFPRYTYEQAKALPYKRVVLMLQTAEKENAKKMLELLNIVVAPHTKGGAGIKTMISHFQSIIEK